MRKVKIALILVLLPCVLPRIRHFFPGRNLLDFSVYYTAATLARQHQGLAIYSGADTGADPQLVVTDASTIFGRTAFKSGIRSPMLYVYPPILADLVAPLSVFPLPTAGLLWTIFNFAQLPVIASFIIRLLKIPLLSLGSLAILVGMFCSAPILSCISFGQISIFLVLLWVGGVYFYYLESYALSGFLFALATAIKLTPLIVVIPLLIWKDWKLLRNFAVSIVFLGLVTCIVNSPASLTDYFFHVVPSMTRGIPHVMNWSISATIQRLYVALHHGPIFPSVNFAIPRLVALLTKLCSAAALVLVTLPIYRRGAAMGADDRVMVLAVVAVLAVCISPVSWAHAFPVCIFALALCWAHYLHKGASNLQLLLLMLCSLTLTSYLVSYLVYKLVEHPAYNIFTCLFLLLPPVSALLLCWLGLSTIRPQASSGLVAGQNHFKHAVAI